MAILAQPVTFADVQVGDRLEFDTPVKGQVYGYASTSRTGTVIRKTDRTVVVRCDDSPADRFHTATARLLAAHWERRQVRRLTEVQALPRTVENVIYRDLGDRVYAVYAAAPDVAEWLRDPATSWDEIARAMWRKDVEQIGSALRWQNGAWEVEVKPRKPVRSADKAAAVAELRHLVAEQIG